MADWTDRIVGARMAVDQEFTERVAESRFSRQQWGLIMTAVAFDVEHPDDPDRARIVADTSKLPAVLPELDNVESAMQGTVPGQQSERSGGLLGGLRDALGFGGGDGGDASADEQQQAAAEELAQEYAAELQAHLESNDRWEEVRVAARE
jgi:hypothetical protein